MPEEQVKTDIKETETIENAEAIKAVEEIPEAVSEAEDVYDINDISDINVEEVNVEALAAAEEEEESESQPEIVVSRKIPYNLIISISALVIALVAFIFSMVKTELTIGQGKLIVEGGIVNEMLSNMIRNDLDLRIKAGSTGASRVRLRDINIQVVLYGYNDYMRVSDIKDTDKVSAEIVFFPQESVERFAEDCHAVLGVMKQSEVEYDEITFIATDTLTEIYAVVSGRYSMDISVEEIMDITIYFGEVKD